MAETPSFDPNTIANSANFDSDSESMTDVDKRNAAAAAMSELLSGPDNIITDETIDEKFVDAGLDDLTKAA